MPWKKISDPYKIWLSEIILQQTRVEQGTNYYLKITQKYPTVKHLANANEQELFSLWQGLGYYSRCRNLLFTAKTIMNEHQGIFPAEFEKIIKLKGIGEYTASAIASFAFNLPYAVVDGNVVRVLSRVFALKENFYSNAGKKFFQVKANELLDKKNPANYNQAIMDFGATVCKPMAPLCNDCLFNKICKAKLLNKVDEFPTKKEKLKLIERQFYFAVIEDKQHVYITQRTEKDIWHNLYSLPMQEINENITPNTQLFANKINTLNIIAKEKQVLSHQKIYGYFYKIPISKIKEKELLRFKKIKKTEISQFAFPKLIISFFQKNNYL